MRTLSLVPLLLLAASFARAQAPEKPPGVEKTLTLEPAAAPRPALRFRLLPEISDLKPGNAVQGYYRAMLPESFSHRRMPDIDKSMERWRTSPRNKLPREEMNWLLTYPALKECDAAARRDQCDWAMIERLRKDGFEARLDDMQGMREINRLLILRARLQQADGKFEDAVTTLQTCFTQARQIGHAPVLICALIGAACANATLAELEELIQTPGAPNLYWALAGMPTPFIDFRGGIEGEKIALLAAIPEINLRDRAMSAAESVVMLERVAHIASLMESQGEMQNSAIRHLLLAATAAGLSPESRQRLEAAGFKADLVKAMPAPQAVLLDWSSRYQEAFDEYVRFTYLPYWVARPHLLQLEAEKKGRDIPFFGSILPAIARSQFALLRVDRKIAMLRTVEALRLYAAAHQGQFPVKLADLIDAPAPVDPVTGAPFEYQLEGAKATLRAPPPAGEAASAHNAQEYVLVLKQKG